jgi:hypothetical protein
MNFVIILLNVKCASWAVGWIRAEVWVFMLVYIYNNQMVKIVRINSLVGIYSITLTFLEKYVM